MNVDSACIFLFLALYFFQEWVVLRESILWGSNIRLLRGEGNKEGVLESVEVASALWRRK